MRPDRRQARILAMQCLCQLDVQGAEVLDHLGTFLAESDAKPATQQHARALVGQCWERREELKARITSHLERWDLQRLSPVERNVIRVALIELLNGEVPPKVVINEALEIGRQFGGAESPGFINGILDALWKQDGEAESKESEVKSEK